MRPASDGRPDRPHAGVRRPDSASQSTLDRTTLDRPAHRSPLVTAGLLGIATVATLAVLAAAGATDPGPQTTAGAGLVPASANSNQIAGVRFVDVPPPPTPAEVDTLGATALTPRVPKAGPGTFRVATVKRAAASDRGRLIRFSVRVERGLPIDPREAALLISRVLDDGRSWSGSGRWRFALVDKPSKASLHVYLASPRSTDRLCAPLLTRGSLSCKNGNRVVLNARRWIEGASAYGTDVATYRVYLINHEVGHAVGYDHRDCPGAHRLAPVMMQQTKGVGRCRANPWPYPRRDSQLPHRDASTRR